MHEGTQPGIEDVLGFWFGDSATGGSVDRERQRLWFGGGDALDREIGARFGALVEQALAGKLPEWRASARGRLALVILIDQFARNVFRGTARAFAGDVQARELARATLAEPLAPLERMFLLLPFEHSEDMDDQDFAVAGYEALAHEAPAESRAFLAACVGHAEQHRDMIRRFGRFPHRNRALGRASTAAELAWLETAPRFGQ